MQQVAKGVLRKAGTAKWDVHYLLIEPKMSQAGNGKKDVAPFDVSTHRLGVNSPIVVREPERIPNALNEHKWAKRATKRQERGKVTER